ncbi:hypothetical protein MG293_019086 [Ovis ammon polii]|uniref:Uncharacterized protein n=1 Tax=Ovis ammon polii TaxID=230172 RepID=A0AAD4TN90_OVIAM|nr:hypothetical protein MG293_019086 [Ovis ammon polii]
MESRPIAMKVILVLIKKNFSPLLQSQKTEFLCPGHSLTFLLHTNANDITCDEWILLAAQIIKGSERSFLQTFEKQAKCKQQEPCDIIRLVWSMTSLIYIYILTKPSPYNYYTDVEMLNSENGKQKALLTYPAFQRKNGEYKMKTLGST